ncbi:MAG TPA: LCP family protein [Mycobacteriales bacterium]|nr:LCP family protein [Mycobacteriales bacterium]
MTHAPPPPPPPTSPSPRQLPPELDPRGPRHRQPTPPGRTRGRKAARFLSWTAIALSIITLVVSVVGYGLFHYYEGRLGTVHLGLGGKDRPAAGADGSAQNFLLVGSDTRNFAGGQQYQGTGADYVTGQRSDTVMLAHIPPGKARATIVSFPRDSWVEIPAYTDGQGHLHPAHMGKLNSAFALGGPRLLVEMIEQLTGMRVDHYVQIDFAGFKNMVNALGGVTLCIGTTRHDHDSGDFLTAGTHQVTGDQALAFVRDRKGLPRGDIDRIADQQYFLAQMLKKVLSAGTLANPFKINGFLQALTASVQVDDNFGFSAMQTLALRLRHLDPAHVAMVTIPITTDNGYRDGQSVVLIDQTAADGLFASLRDETSSQPAKTTPPKVTVAPGDVHVVVLNGTARNGLARSTGDALAAEGFHVDRFGNATSHALARTTVRYSAGHKEAAQTVAAATGAVLQQDDTVGDAIMLVLGGDFTQVQALAGGPAPSTAPSSAPTGVTPAPKTAATAACAP